MLSLLRREPKPEVMIRQGADLAEPARCSRQQNIKVSEDCSAAFAALARAQGLRAIMKLAKRRKMIKTNPMIEVEPIRYKVQGYKDWSDAEIAMFEVCYRLGTRERLALELLLCAAPRRSDLVKLGPRNLRGGRLVYKQKKDGR